MNALFVYFIKYFQTTYTTRYLKKVEDSDTANNITIKKLEQQLAEAVKVISILC